MRFIHCADLHLDSPMEGLGRGGDAPAEILRAATRQAFVNVVDYCLDEVIDFLIIAGDLVDSDARTTDTAAFFVQQVKRLQKMCIPVYVVGGDHEARRRAFEGVEAPSNLFVFEAARPHTHCLDHFKVAIHGMSSASVDGTPEVVAAYPHPVPGYFNIGLLHSSLDGRPSHAPHSPCDVETLFSKGYDYWALGHVHRRELLHAAEPCVLWAGNLQGRHPGEAGPKGCTSVLVEDGWVELAHISLDAVRWAELGVDASSSRTRHELLEHVGHSLRCLLRAADDRLVAIRVCLRGDGPVVREIGANPSSFHAQLASLAARDAEGEAWIEGVVVNEP